MKHFIIEEKFTGYANIRIEAETEEEALIEKITDKTGWCIKSIKYCENRPHSLTSYK